MVDRDGLHGMDGWYPSSSIAAIAEHLFEKYARIENGVLR